MFQSKTKFLAARHTNQLDQFAQRALVLDGEFTRLQANAYNLGKSGGIEACQRGRSICMAIFAIAHKERRYGFATDVSENINAIAASFPSTDSVNDAGDLLAAVELAIDTVRKELPAVCLVSGGGVQILRGEHVEAAMRNVVAQNDNRSQA
ncbi:MAG: hypothetical protein SGJ27_10360 [Candidatus Melainabacteria bacterium]|nr:hypothetical protein [Candidatus Melainabacteria bacterium]